MRHALLGLPCSRASTASSAGRRQDRIRHSCVALSKRLPAQRVLKTVQPQRGADNNLHRQLDEDVAHTRKNQAPQKISL
jgi:hypothetical protein